MITMPADINARWLATLGDEQLVAAEAELYSLFRARETAEKSRTGTKYMLLQGPAELVNAWRRWSIVSNETRDRGVIVRRRS